VARTFQYALVPHAGDWRQAGVYRHGLEFNSPLLVRKAAVHAGDVPKRYGLVEISSPNVVLSAFRPGPEKSTVLRIYEASGTAAPGVKIKLAAKIVEACEANLLEDAGKTLKVEDNAVRFDLRPFEIRTIRLKLSGQHG
jgi:alpha-mannosidase